MTNQAPHLRELKNDKYAQASGRKPSQDLNSAGMDITQAREEPESTTTDLRAVRNFKKYAGIYENLLKKITLQATQANWNEVSALALKIENTQREMLEWSEFAGYDGVWIRSQCTVDIEVKPTINGKIQEGTENSEQMEQPSLTEIPQSLMDQFRDVIQAETKTLIENQVAKTILGMLKHGTIQYTGDVNDLKRLSEQPGGNQQEQEQEQEQAMHQEKPERIMQPV